MAFKAWLDEIRVDEDEPSGRKETTADELRPDLEKAAWAIIVKARDEIMASGCWQYSPAVKEAEAAVNEAYRNLLSGEGTLPEFREACERWKEAGMRRADSSGRASPAEGTRS